MGRYSNLLNNRQLSIMMYIIDYSNSVGYSPTIREICNGVNLKSSSTVHGHLNKLESLGYITKNIDTPRSIVVTDKYFSLYTDEEYNDKEDICSSLKDIYNKFDKTVFDCNPINHNPEIDLMMELNAHNAGVLYAKLNDSFDYIKENIVTESQFKASSKISLKIPTSSLITYLGIHDSTSCSVIESNLSSVVGSINEYSDKKISYGDINYLDKNPYVEFFWHINSMKPTGISIIF